MKLRKGDDDDVPVGRHCKRFTSLNEQIKGNGGIKTTTVKTPYVNKAENDELDDEGDSKVLKKA